MNHTFFFFLATYHNTSWNWASVACPWGCMYGTARLCYAFVTRWGLAKTWYLSNFASQGFMLLPILHCWSEIPGWKLRFCLVTTSSCVLLGYWGQNLLLYFRCDKSNSDKYFPHYSNNKQIEVYHTKSGWHETSCNQGFCSSDMEAAEA